MFCSKCGNEVTDDALFCPKCGNSLKNQIKPERKYEGQLEKTDIAELEPEIKHKKVKMKKWKFILPVAAVSAVIVVIGMLVILFYEVRFSGGSISIKASSYGIKEIKAFDKQLRLAKEEYLEKIRQNIK